ncbi:hypothetical protein KO537_09620 [Shewanella sp. NKUCC01_JLK]|uniref:hypothetical protein n=1 Tax=Shewanella sp. NKUCC01_JLK TaxID=2842123 RepID=UPI001C5B2E5B|nr:hypothetical protein [Shewanella sp. NKUCC01_JLK]MBW3514980.1 hypothetical protein [Shewanella sp. NKUCC01_JLK]
MAFETISLGTQPAGTGGDTARTAFEKVNRNFIAADVLAAAMSQAQFEANRNANKELYAASGWVSFGNHESGKQVNECKPGLYTALTTPNTLLIGKAGGVGGSKTDYASVHIDGVIFNFTNQFVLTLPSPPTSAMPERMDMYGVEAEKVEISAASPNAYQGGLRGVGAAVNLFSATEQQKKDFFTQNSNTTFIGSDGKIYQWQVYKIAFAGSTDGLPSPTEQGYSLNSFGDLWLKAGKNLLYFGNVLRLNDGGYHPSHNPLGAAKFVGDTFWYNTTASITSRSDCFNPSKLLAGSGSIASGKSGRFHDTRYYDAVYAYGEGGLCRDMRYKAQQVNQIDFDNAESDFYNGIYKGFENIIFTTVYSNSFGGDSSPVNETNIVVDSTAKMKVGDSGYILSFDGATPLKVKIKTIYDETIIALIPFYSGELITRRPFTPFIHEMVLPFLVGGYFSQTDVLAHPDEINNRQSLKNGWFGKWIPDLRIGYNIFKLTRKLMLDGGFASVYLSDSDNSWSAGSVIADVQTNTIATTLPSTSRVTIFQYQSNSKQTESAINSSVFGKYSGIGRMYVTSMYTLSFLSETLIGKLLTSSGGNSPYEQSLSVDPYIMGRGYASSPSFWGKLAYFGDDYATKHDEIKIGAPTGGDIGLKVLRYNTVENSYASLSFAATELKYSNGNWGDDGKVTTVDNQATKTDLNGNTVLVGTAKLKEPLGWLRNKV